MGECMSLCNTRGLESEGIKDNRNFQLPINDLEILKPPSLVEKKNTTEEKKELNKQRTPRLVKFTMDEKENPSKSNQKDPCLNFEEVTDDIKNEKSDGEKLNEEQDISGLKYEEEEKDKKIEEINTDIPAKPEKSWGLLSDKLISNKISKLKDLEDSDEEDTKKEDKKEDNNNENNMENNEKDKEIKNNDEIKKNEENKKNENNLEIKDEKKDEQKNDEKKEENEEEEEENEEEEEKENTGKEKDEKEEKKDINEKTEDKFIENKENEGKKVKEVKVEKEEKEEKEENISNENNENQIAKEKNIMNENKENKVENEIKAEKIEEINVKKESENTEANNNQLLRGPQNKKEEEKKKEENEEDIDEEEEEEEDDEEEEKKNPESSKNQKEKSNSKDLSKYDLLIKIINKNLEAKGFSKSDVKNKIDNVYNSLPNPVSSEDLSSKLIENLVKLLEITIESDKIEIANFIKDLMTIYENDKDKIYEKLMNFIEGIEEQEKLKTRKLNRQIRGYIKECQDKLKNRLKEEDIPSDKIISFEKFFDIVEETGVNLKEGYMDVLLYQMKIAVPKGKPINSVNAIVIVDFLK